MKQNGNSQLTLNYKHKQLKFFDNFQLRSPAQDTKLQFNCPPGSQVAVGHFKASSTEQQWKLQQKYTGKKENCSQ